ncbi:AAA family ATPase [Phycisphaera mikurensis]|uniref:Putative chromosome partitioning protein n=1 Tax=Phycisphaera mikurensis (strain NBRC 102666 / KCTC 22515 / FYK2301M01) TaxID=1142394 RepID=I0IIS3_PHYMF|nr:AAA family ATPase [Phycisphaera mikurensis]MBB6442691.1 chromosome partitioning protein [Phycisphaera mikurensis]BAM05161.1 putative chromosome partitioning protein [Phycisphaera mikurensis NBRC 102666]
MRTTAIINQKGGCGKTTTAIHLSSELARRGRKTLLVDMDPQSHCALGLSVPEDGIEHGVADLLGGGRNAEGEPIAFEDCLWRVRRNLDLLPSSLALAGIEQRLSNASDRDRRLAAVLGRAEGGDYAHCIIDCPPSIGLLTFNALRACQEVLIPVETGYFALQGAIKQARTIDMLARRAGHRVRFSVLPTLHRADRNIDREILGQMKRHFGEQVLPLCIHEDEKLREAAGFGRAIGEYDPDGSAAADFVKLADWLVAHPPEPAEMLAPLAAETRDANPAGEAPAPVPGDTAPDPTPAGAAGPARLSRAAELVARTRDLSRRNAESLAARDTPPAAPTPAVLPAAIERLCGCRCTRNGTLFVQPGDAGARITIAGSWNGWDPEATAMTRNAELGVWQALVKLPAGRHAYRLVIDGQWAADPFNRLTEVNPLGEANSVAEVVAEPVVADPARVPASPVRVPAAPEPAGA